MLAPASTGTAEAWVRIECPPRTTGGANAEAGAETVPARGLAAAADCDSHFSDTYHGHYMKRFRPKLPSGYHQQTYESPYWIVRYPHQVRLRTAVEAIVSQSPAVLLDYGAGEGHLLFEAIDQGFSGRIVAYEPVELFWSKLIAEAERRGVSKQIELVTKREDLRGPFDLITCLGVLEHMPLPERESFYDLCRTELASREAGGRALIDVPVEIGPTLLVKNAARIILKGRKPEYRWRELLRYGVGGTMHDPSRYDGADTRTWILDHKGFDYRLLDREIRDRGFLITGRRSTPIRWLPAPFLNQERFLTMARR